LSIICGVIGTLAVWDVELNGVSTCSLVTAMCYAIVFTVPITYHYVLHAGDDKRLHHTIRSAAAPVLQVSVPCLLHTKWRHNRRR
jgi:hypothetical protein